MAAIVWKGYISFGLVSFPVRLFAAARPKAIHFHMLHAKDLSRVKEVFYCAQEDIPIGRDEIVKGAEVKKGKYVVVTDEELKKTAPATASTVDIQRFVPADEIDPIYFNASYYVAPQEKLEKPYLLLMQAMIETGHDAVAKIAMHGREHVVVLRPDGKRLVLHTLYFADELQESNAPSLAKGKAFTAKEAELAKTLIRKLAGPFEPGEYRDEYKENVERLIEQKERGQKVMSIRQPKAKPVADIMKALQQSLAETQKSSKKAPRKRSRRAA